MHGHWMFGSIFRAQEKETLTNVKYALRNEPQICAVTTTESSKMEKERALLTTSD